MIKPLLTSNIPFRLWIGGLGGQGVNFISQLLCQALHQEQQQVWARSDQEWAIRGGRVMASVLSGPQAFSPAEAPDYNWKICLHPKLRELEVPSSADLQVIDAYALELYRYAESAHFAQGLNILALGILLARTQLCHPNAVVWQLRRLLGREQMAHLPYNLDLLEKGLELGRAGHS